MKQNYVFSTSNYSCCNKVRDGPKWFNNPYNMIISMQKNEIYKIRNMQPN